MINLNQLKKMKKDKIPVAWVTAYDYPLAYAAEKAGVDMILVGDSGGMCQLGYKSTNPVTMDEMITMAKAVRRGAPDTFIIGDMPQGSYEASNEDAVNNAMRFVKEAGCNAVKLEGGYRVRDRVYAIHLAGILVMGHLGLTPQSADSFGGYRVQGKTVESLKSVLINADALVRAGVFAILLEAMPTFASKVISSEIDCLVYGIGAGMGVDGQLLLSHDLLGFYPNFRPKFAKCFIPSVIDEFNEGLDSNLDKKRLNLDDGFISLATAAYESYINDVSDGTFPGEKYSYQLTDEEITKLVVKFGPV